MKILLAVSGGIDSMYMANRASELFPGARFAVAHCNFCLRGKESDEDETFVREWCSAHDIPLHARRFDTEGYADSKGISIEMAARELRYAWFEELRREYSYDATAVAHNADDNAETLMLNLLRGTGSRGLRGMSDRNGIVRPLLGTSRSEIREWMRSRNMEWREDRTNRENVYKRNKIRNEVFPIFEEINPSYIRTLNEDMKRFAQVDDIAEDYFASVRDGLSDEDGDILISELLKLRHWEFVLWRMLEESGIGRQEFDSLTSLLKSDRQAAGKVFGPVCVGSNRLTIRKDHKERRLVFRIVDRCEIKSLKTEKGVLLLDADKISMPPIIRKWKAGDWMRPFGMRGKKKLSDIFTDSKWSVFQKENAEVIELEGSHVAALLCERIDEAVKIDDKTKRVMIVSYSSSMKTSSPGSAKK